MTQIDEIGYVDLLMAGVAETSSWLESMRPRVAGQLTYESAIFALASRATNISRSVAHLSLTEAWPQALALTRAAFEAALNSRYITLDSEGRSELFWAHGRARTHADRAYAHSENQSFTSEELNEYRHDFEALVQSNGRLPEYWSSKSPRGLMAELVAQGQDIWSVLYRHVFSVSSRFLHPTPNSMMVESNTEWARVARPTAVRMCAVSAVELLLQDLSTAFGEDTSAIAHKTRRRLGNASDWPTFATIRSDYYVAHAIQAFRADCHLQ